MADEAAAGEVADGGGEGPKDSEEDGDDRHDGASAFDAELAAIDAVLARSEAAIEQARKPGPSKKPGRVGFHAEVSRLGR